MSEMIRLPKSRELFFNKQVDQASIGELTKSIVEINNDDELLVKIYEAHGLTYKPRPIKIHIDSYGGYVYQCYGLLSVMEASKTPVHTIVTGAAMSCGFMILICGHRRFAHELSTPLYHQISGGAFGTIKEVQEQHEEMKRLQNKLEEIVLKKTKISKKKLKEIFETKKDWYMTAKEAKELGVVDELL